jgi:hypothetical protein
LGCGGASKCNCPAADISLNGSAICLEFLVSNGTDKHLLMVLQNRFPHPLFGSMVNFTLSMAVNLPDRCEHDVMHISLKSLFWTRAHRVDAWPSLHFGV